ncbi:MAG: hypothetical protein HN742_09200 [Lentisphaerae bacterium]|jgi:hypothetical protein|nr:hypothetical protein [Lentisphaerota bacterium]MBT5612046.1 hypothetical protein [Lentisphaerota bacterium]MBT7053658.1 hypothetical protein [Lentisphaerota bacterium]MBT7842037.1 hypothetical protein [Lentisphaerota bacterium]
MADQEKPEGVVPQESGAASATDEGKSLRTAIVFSSIVLWIMAIFMINILYSVNAKLDSIEQMIPGFMSVVSRQPLEAYQIMDAEGKEVVNTFRLDPATTEPGPEAMGSSCPGGEMMAPTGEEGGSGTK